MKKKGLIILLAVVAAVVLIALAIGLFLIPAVRTYLKEPKLFSGGGINITLTREFKTTSADGFAAAYESGDVAVLARREPFNLYEGFGDYTLEEYGNLVILANKLGESAELTRSGNLTYFVYGAYGGANSDRYVYYTVVFKASDAFWLVQFATEDKEFEEYQDSIISWAQSISFDD